MTRRDKETVLAFAAIVVCVTGAIVMTNLYVTGEAGSIVPAFLLAGGGIVATVIFYLTYAKRR